MKSRLSMFLIKFFRTEDQTSEPFRMWRLRAGTEKEARKVFKCENPDCVELIETIERIDK